MKVIRENIGTTEVYIQTLDESLVVVGSAQKGRATKTTGIEESLMAAYKKARSVIKEIAQDIGSELKSVTAMARPDEVEMEFSLGISSEGKVVWLVSGKGEFGMKVTMNWKLGTDETHAGNKGG